MKRIKSYYRGLGYKAPYRWAQQTGIPLSKPVKPINKICVGIVTTASLFDSNNGDQGPGAKYNGKAKFFKTYVKPIDPFPDLRISHIAIDRAHTTATDIGSYFPLAAFQRLAKEKYIGSVSPNFYGLPTNRSQKTTIEVDCPRLVGMCKKDNLDAVVLVPNCPVCHQSVALAAVQLEKEGISTVIIGCALDIIQYVGAPRFVFNDLPLGNSAGIPHDNSSQDITAKLAINALYKENKPRAVVKSPLRWRGSLNWKKDYSNIELLSKKEIIECRIEMDLAKADVNMHDKDLH
jgi:hypothetical protein